MQLRQYQSEFEAGIYGQWNQGALNVCGVMPTGGGKTPTFAKIISDNVGASCAIAHRQELVEQMSLALSSFEVRHRIIAPNNVIRGIIQQQITNNGRSFYDPNAPCAVAGVDTLINRVDELKNWFNQVNLWVTDEAHHLVRTNKWGKATELFPNARGLGVTATPLRADGKGLGRHADGVFDSLVIGPTMRELINLGYLTDYRIYCPPSDLDLDGVTVSNATGDYNPKQLKQRVKKSHIVGDVVTHYLRFAPGKQGVTFATDIETAGDIKQQFNDAGIRAEIITGKTPIRIRREILQRFKLKQIQQIINVDIMGEGVDIPGIEVISMARPTESYGLYVQQFGRALRILLGKGLAIIIDHVGNVIRHGLPDAPKHWTLDRRERRIKGAIDPNVIPMRQCLNPECAAPYEAIYKACPFCGTLHVPPGRSKPEFVDGDLTELDAETLRQMRNEIAKIDAPIIKGTDKISGANAKRRRLKQEGQVLLRQSISWWSAHHKAMDKPESEIYRRFYFKFGVDIMTAQTLNAKESEKLAVTINKSIDEMVNNR